MSQEQSVIHTLTSHLSPPPLWYDLPLSELLDVLRVFFCYCVQSLVV
jgi:hypothetical protein